METLAVAIREVLSASTNSQKNSHDDYITFFS